MSISALLTGHEKDLGGGFKVRRVLPSSTKQAVGPFLFFDHFGPIDVPPHANHDVRPHPHIGLATVTYLFEGAINHRDSLGSVQRIEPGAINWMTAGNGIVHSERAPTDLVDKMHRMHGLQLWAGLPKSHEETEPSFTHTPATAIPALKIDGADIRILIGTAFGLTSPVATFSETLYLDVILRAGQKITFDVLP
ncbi:MAG: pirin family protein, partial [Burkholderiaceae bacterium]